MSRNGGPSGSLFELLLPQGMRVLPGELAEVLDITGMPADLAEVSLAVEEGAIATSKTATETGRCRADHRAKRCRTGHVDR